MELDTKALEWAMGKIPAHRQQWVTKQMMGQFVHRKNVQQ